MCEKLRKVTFTLGRNEFNPEPTPREQAEMEELTKQRNGYFHKWVEDVDYSKEIPFVKSMALVEEVESGEMHVVESYNIKFVVDSQ